MTVTFQIMQIRDWCSTWYKKEKFANFSWNEDIEFWIQFQTILQIVSFLLKTMPQRPTNSWKQKWKFLFNYSVICEYFLWKI